MANTYTQLYVQFVFATQYRLAQIQPAVSLSFSEKAKELNREMKGNLVSFIRLSGTKTSPQSQVQTKQNRI